MKRYNMTDLTLHLHLLYHINSSCIYYSHSPWSVECSVEFSIPTSDIIITNKHKINICLL